MLKYILWLITITGLLSFAGCSSDDDIPTLKSQGQHKVEAAPTKYIYSIYLESSGSINGYLNANGDGSFKDNVNSLIAAINGFSEKQSLNLYDVNTKIIPVAVNANGSQVDKYISHFDAPTFKERSKANGGDQTQSDLSDIIRNVVDSTRKNEVSILISDCIFSPGRKKNALDYLSEQKGKLQICINEKLKAQALSTLMLQFTSDFNGTYYDQNNARNIGKFNDRPYYVVCFGREEALHNLLRYIQGQDRFKGFRNFLFLTDAGAYNVAPRIEPYTACYEYDADEPMTVKSVESGGRDHKFRIKTEVNFSKLPVGEAYLNDHNNYTVSGGYAIDSITPSGKNGFTHQIVLIADKPQTGKLNVSLKKQLPQWVMASNLDSDSNLSADALKGKTFGIRYLLEGIFLAYDSYSHSPDYFTFSISVKE